MPASKDEESKDPTRTLTTRLPASEARRAELVARAEGISLNELTRRSLTAFIDARCADEKFLAHARALVEQDAALIASQG